MPPEGKYGESYALSYISVTDATLHGESGGATARRATLARVLNAGLG